MDRNSKFPSRFEWRVQPNQHPNPACLHNPVVVQAQRLDGCATTRCQPFHRVAMVTPGEMLRPTLPSWVKKRVIGVRGTDEVLLACAIEVAIGLGG
ncbi:MAG: hypothetical protein ACRERE_38340 [Candidatus Entotheonellia bacterium]